jgi:hypothetical protein
MSEKYRFRLKKVSVKTYLNLKQIKLKNGQLIKF